VAFRVIERGTADHTIDQGLKRQAVAAGVNLHYKSRVKPEDCQIVAAGPKDTSALAYGEIFHTNYPNTVAFHFNDKLAPGAYAYLIVIDGVGLICTCLWRKQKKSERFLNETIAWYDKHYPDLNRRPIKRVGGQGDFTINKNYTVDGRHYVGEAGGLQDFMWGFGMRCAITSGVFAAKDILGECNYDDEVRTRLLPTVKTSVSNRWLMNRVGDRAFKRMSVTWMKDQKKRQDGLPFIGKLFRPDFFRGLVYHFAAKWMLKKVDVGDSRIVHRLPYRKALKRDVWEPSEAAKAVGEQWKIARRSGKTASFSEEE
jgi:flavin-dependent dehydrogenase